MSEKQNVKLSIEGAAAAALVAASVAKTKIKTESSLDLLSQCAELAHYGLLVDNCTNYDNIDNDNYVHSETCGKTSANNAMETKTITSMPIDMRLKRSNKLQPVLKAKQQQLQATLNDSSISSSSSSSSSSNSFGGSRRKTAPPPSYDETVQRISQKRKLSRSDASNSVSMCNIDIEEHFRKSLGPLYNKNISKSLKATNSTKAIKCNENASYNRDNRKQFLNDFQIEGYTVDDHFSKALGSDTWSRYRDSGSTALNSISSNAI